MKIRTDKVVPGSRRHARIMRKRLAAGWTLASLTHHGWGPVYVATFERAA
jgi:hypothetical protein